MSAIAGLFYRNGKCVEDTELHRMREALQAHGLNGGGAWRKGAIGLLQQQIGFTPEDFWERQPVFSPDQQITLVSAARLDNRPELARELGLPFPGPDSRPDSEFLMQAYLRWGADCPRHLIGDYTFAVWNEREQSLLLAVSPFSGRPLHYHSCPEFFAFSTMPKGLFALKGVPHEFDEDYLAKYLARVPRTPESTFYRGLCRVLPGHSIQIIRDRIVRQPFWKLDADRELRFTSDAECEEAFLALYERVVNDHLRSASPVGLMLSGGLDSSSLAAMAAPLLQAKNQRLTAFTQVPRPGFQMSSERGRYADETPFVEAIAARYDNIDLHLIAPDGRHFLQESDQLFHHAEVPFRNACNRPWFEGILQAAQAQGVHVVLIGAQGNLTVSWKGEEPLPRFVQQGEWRNAWRESHRMAQAMPAASAWKTLIRHGLLPLLPASLFQALPRASDRPLLRREYVQASGLTLSGHALSSLPARTASDRRASRAEAILKSVGGLSNLKAGYQAMFQVELRDPTADQRLVEFCLALPDDQFRRGDVSRRLLRRTMTGRLPPEVVENRRRGQQAADWVEQFQNAEIKAEIKQMAECHFAASVLDLSGVSQALAQLSSSMKTDEPIDMRLRNYLEHGLMTGRFIHWFQGGN
jgi:asparagine synthase (glutamine-hydrolysing)